MLISDTRGFILRPCRAGSVDIGVVVVVRVEGVSFDWKAIKDARDAYVRRLNGIYGTMLKNSGVTVISGVGHRRRQLWVDVRARLRLV